MRINLETDVYCAIQTNIINIGMPTVFLNFSNNSNINFSYKDDVLAKQIFNMSIDYFGVESGLYHPGTRQPIQLAIGGNDPMAKQSAIAAIINELDNYDDYNTYPVLIETESKYPIDFELKRFVYYTDHVYNISCNIPLFDKQVSYNKEIIESYADNSNSGCINLIVNGSTKCWNRVDELTEDLSEIFDVNPNWSLWISISDAMIDNVNKEDIYVDAIKRGYNMLGNQ